LLPNQKGHEVESTGWHKRNGHHHKSNNFQKFI